MVRRLSMVLGAAALMLGAAACSSCDQSSGIVGGGDTAVDGGDWRVGADATGDGGGVADADEREDGGEGLADGSGGGNCGDGVVCGDGCCEAGRVCVEGVCRDPCDGTRCGEMSEQCCSDSEVCIFESCQAPGETCQNSFQCPDDEYCEETLGRCLSRSAQSEQCTWQPPTGEFTPERKGHYEGVETDGRSYDKVMATPTVADVDDDDLPEIVSLLYRGGLSGALITIVDGTEMSTIAYGAVEEIQPNSAGIAVGQLDPSTPELEIVAPHVGGGLIALRYDASEQTLSEWWTLEEGGLGDISTESAPAIADVDGNGEPEIVFGFSIVTADGEVWNGVNEGPAGGQRANSAITTAVDLDGEAGMNGNDDLEIVAGNRVMRLDGSLMWDRSDEISEGFPAVGDFGGDGSPEVVVVTDGEVYVLDAQTGDTVFGPRAIPGGGEGGPPTIADFDGDESVEFAAAGQGRYTVYDLACEGDDPSEDLCPSGSSDGILWSVDVQDTSSSRTGSSVFDFEGDGRAEVVYNDECHLRVFDGRTGDVLFERANTSRTGSEYPIVADVDRDFNAEIVVASNNDQLDRDDCRETYDDYPDQGTHGIFVYGDADDRWVPTRTVWNQHAYHITNVLEDGTIPTDGPVHYDSSITNSFRLNVQPDGLFNAPDLIVDEVTVREGQCEPVPTLEVRVTIANDGALGVGPGVGVEVVATFGGSTVDLGRVETTGRLLPGQSETVSVEWEVPEQVREGSVSLSATVDGADEINECDSDNNTADLEVDGTSLEFASLTPTALSIDDTSCGAADRQVDFEVTVENQGAGEVPAGVPVVVRASDEGETIDLASVQTSAALGPGESETVTGSWETPERLFEQAYEVAASIDPNRTAETCGGAESESVDADCTISQ